MAQVGAAVRARSRPPGGRAATCDDHLVSVVRGPSSGCPAAGVACTVKRIWRGQEEGEADTVISKYVLVDRAGRGRGRATA